MQELKNLPDEILVQLCSVYTVMEEIGLMPSISLHGDVTMIPKDAAKHGVDNLRPITVLTFYIGCGVARGYERLCSNGKRNC